MSVATPILDKAVDNELTSSEIWLALGELQSIDPDRRHPRLKIGRNYFSTRKSVTLSLDLDGHHKFESDEIEDVLIKAYLQIKAWRAQLDADAA